MLFAVTPLAMAQAIPGYPENIRGFDRREVAMLPKYCTYTQDFREHVQGGNDPVQIERWYGMMGEMFHHMHHYCYGLMKTNRALYLVREAQGRRAYLESSITEFDYVLGHAPEGFILTPEILLKKGENLIRLGKAPLGIELLEQSAQLKPDYWPPYATMSDHFREAGDLKKARELLTTGLSFAPDAKALQRRLAELDAEEAKRPKGAPASSTQKRQP